MLHIFIYDISSLRVNILNKRNDPSFDVSNRHEVIYLTLETDKIE